MAEKYTNKFVFPKTINLLLPLLVLGAIGAATYVPTVLGLGTSPETTDVGYNPSQPVAYSHALHVGQLGLDCRYCHTTVDKSGFAALPPTQTCMNCHNAVRTNSEKLAPVRDSWKTGKSIPWVEVHDLPDFAYFNHSAHVNKGVSCVSCHARVDHMADEGVYQAKSLSMGWCIDCHRKPEEHLRPKDQVTNLGWTPADLARADAGTESARVYDALQKAHPGMKEFTQKEVGELLRGPGDAGGYQIRDRHFMTSCSTCHR
ncbi:MAG TPA: cytochrome c3 family protein [Tepidisphaeraceae bacterium]|jgi:hypothetical protein